MADEFDDMYDDEDADTMANKYMTFKVGEEVFAIAIQSIVEIVEMQKITEVPDMPGFVKGVINLRGRIIPVIDLRIRFNLTSRDYDDRTCIVIIEINKTAIGFIVDIVEEVATITENNIAPPPDFKTASGKEKYIKGLGKVGEAVKIILDVEKLLYGDDLNKIKEIAHEEAKV
jgi:purine-binding chemotaxis protein CheW